MALRVKVACSYTVKVAALPTNLCTWTCYKLFSNLFYFLLTRYRTDSNFTCRTERSNFYVDGNSRPHKVLATNVGRTLNLNNILCGLHFFNVFLGKLILLHFYFSLQ